MGASARHRSHLPRSVAVLALLAASPTTVRAQSTTPSVHSTYEQETIDRALAKVHGVVEPAPEGKLFEGVVVIPLDVIEDRDPAPSFLNLLHMTTRARVIRREVLLSVGEPYRQYFVDETVRVLRGFRQLSLVLAVPLKGSRPDTVRLLVITKDVWSLRTSIDIGLGANGLDKLKLEPTERNVAGTLHSVFGRFELFPETLTLGGGGYVPRLGGKRLYFSSDANAIINRRGGNVEGVYGQTQVGIPQLTARQEWLWGLSSSWRTEIVRRYLGAELATFDAPSTPEVERIPDAYRARRFTQSFQGARSYGLAHKTDVTLGAEVSLREFVGLDPTKFDRRIVEDHLRLRVPTSDTRVAPYAQVRVYESRFFRAHDLDTLGLGEDYRLGYDVWARAFPVTRALGSSRDFVGMDAVAQYALRVADGLARLSGEVMLEVALPATNIQSAMYGANAAFYSPRFALGRLVVDAIMIARPENYLNQRTTLGGEGRLRGQPSAALLGANMLAYNMELRSRPLHVFTSQLASALFFDVGDAFDTWPARPKSSAGFGLRAVLPQFDRNIIRLDVAFPIVRAQGAGPVGFYLAFEQAFPARIPEPPNGLIIPSNAGALGQ